MEHAEILFAGQQGLHTDEYRSYKARTERAVIPRCIRQLIPDDQESTETDSGRQVGLREATIRSMAAATIQSSMSSRGRLLQAESSLVFAGRLRPAEKKRLDSR